MSSRSLGSIFKKNSLSKTNYLGSFWQGVTFGQKNPHKNQKKQKKYYTPKKKKKGVVSLSP